MTRHLILYTSFLAFLLIICSTNLHAQVEKEDIPDVIRQIIEEHAGDQDEALDYSRLIEELNYLMLHPLNINTATAEDFDAFIFLNELQVNDLLKQRQRLGRFDNMFQLQLVESLSYRDIQNLSNFVYTGPIEEKASGQLKRSLKYGRHDIFLRYERVLEQREGYKPIADSVLEESPNKRFLGNPDKYYLRYSYRSRNIRWGFNAEKDPGEEFFSGYQKQGFDFYSGYLMVEDISWIDKIVIGDYNVDAGQGLALWSGLSFGKSVDISAIRKQSRGLRPSTSMNEFGYLRGIAVEKQFGPVSATMFYSRAMRDANAVVIDSLDELSAVSSLQQTGYHYTQSLADDKNVVEEQMYGANISYQTAKLKLGATAYSFNLDKPLEKNSSLYNAYDFHGTRRLVAGVDYGYNMRNFILFGETAWSGNGGWGTVNGFIARPASGIYLSMLYRWYQKDFQNVKGGAFGENSSNQNEEGIYAGITAQLNREFSFKAYADHFRFKWLNYRVDAPSYGSEYMAQLEYDPAKNWSAYLRYRLENKLLNRTADDLIINQPADRKRQGFRMNISWQANNWLKFNNRVEWSQYNMEGSPAENGWLIYQDILLRPGNKPYSLSFRYALFNTDSYNARLYAYEHDVLYAFSIPAYNYEGFRTYLVLKYEITDQIDFWFKIARSQYTNREAIGTGLNEISVPHKTDIKLQLRIKF